ncbi:aldo/keto reductase [Bradyrhizobium liaoningense]|nr:aldo/keto reductase [Bradyrhizobium liaoningense]
MDWSRPTDVTVQPIPWSDSPHDEGTSRHRLLVAVDTSLRRLGTGNIDPPQLHAPDAFTPIEEVLSTLGVPSGANAVRESRRSR